VCRFVEGLGGAWRHQGSQAESGGAV
jgi:hypothetical protein